jgi:hypothetical protein
MTRRSMIRGAVHVAALVAAIALGGADAGAQVPVSRGVRVNADVALKVSVPAGSIRLVGWDADSVHVRGTIGKGDTFYFGAGASGGKFGIDEASGRTPQPAQLIAYIPRGGRVSVRTIGAAIEASDIAGWFTTVAGNIRVGGQASEVQAEAIDGSITLSVTTPYARARTGSGTLVAGGRIEDLLASTVSGPLTVTATGLGRARLESVTGAIIFDASVDRAASIAVDNHSGSVELRLSSDVAADFDLTSVAGTITNGFEKRLPTKSRQGRGEELSFYTDPKGAQVIVRTFKGPIVLTIRPKVRIFE